MADLKKYRPVFSDSAVAFFISLSGRQQRKLLDRAHELAADPFLAPDFREVDAEGRDLGHVVVGDFVFTYWVDHAARQVMITDVDGTE